MKIQAPPLIRKKRRSTRRLSGNGLELFPDAYYFESCHKTLGVKPLSREGNSQTGDWMLKDPSFILWIIFYRNGLTAASSRSTLFNYLSFDRKRLFFGFTGTSHLWMKKVNLE